MIPRAAEVLQALYGAILLARLEARGMDFFDRTLDGFWKSFFAAVLVAPFHFIHLLITYTRDTPETGLAPVLIVKTFAYVITWIAFPVVMYEITRAFGKEAQYRGHIVAYNWALVVQTAVWLPYGLLEMMGLLPEALSVFLGLVITLAFFGYEWFIARTALGLTVAGAMGVVALAFALVVSIDNFAYGLIR